MGHLIPGETPPPPSSTASGARVQGATQAGEGPGPFVMSCGTLSGDAVIDARGDDIGRLEHVMLDVPSGRIAYGVLGRGGVFGIGEKLFAIPWDAFTLDAARRCFVLDVDRERLEKAPGFDRDHWPAMGDAAWATQVHTYYQREPYWGHPGK